LSEAAKLAYVQERLSKVNRRMKYAWLFSFVGAILVIFCYVFEPFLSNARALEIIGVLIVCIGVIVNLVYGTPQKNKLMKQLETKASLNSCKKCGEKNSVLLSDLDPKKKNWIVIRVFGRV